MTAVFSPGSGALEEVAAESFLLLLSVGATSPGLPTSGLLVMAVAVVAETGVATAVLATGGFPETAAAADVVAEPLVGPAAELIPESAAVAGD